MDKNLKNSNGSEPGAYFPPQLDRIKKISLHSKIHSRRQHMKPSRKNGVFPDCTVTSDCDSQPLQTEYLARLIGIMPDGHGSPVILCIGTDRMIGDSLGPLVGSMVEKAARKQLTVYGTLQNTVHALNLVQIREEIKKKHPDRPVIAVDASLGPCHRIGDIYVRPGCLYPGAGVCKSLPGIGHIAIPALANGDISHPYLALQTARLSTIVFMADKISRCLLDVCL